MRYSELKRRRRFNRGAALSAGRPLSFATVPATTARQRAEIISPPHRWQHTQRKEFAPPVLSVSSSGATQFSILNASRFPQPGHLRSFWRGSCYLIGTRILCSPLPISIEEHSEQWNSLSFDCL